MAKEYAKLTVVPGEEPPAKELEETFVARINGSQASLLVKALGQVAPLGILDHLKRIRKDPSGESLQLQIILCAKDPPTAPSQLAKAGSSLQQPSYSEASASHPLCNISTQAALNAELPSVRTRHADTSLCKVPTSSQLVASSAAEGLLARSAQESVVTDGSRPPAADPQQEQYTSNLPDEVAALVKQHQLKLQLVQVPKHAPASREQWKDWNQVWPISWRKPELTAVTAATAAARAVTAAEEHLMHLWMDRAYGLAEAHASSGNVCNAALIVDPVYGEVIAEGQDCTSKHPLRHALMVAIDAAAARDRRLWPFKSKDANTAGVRKSNRPQADTEAASPDSSIAFADVNAPVKRRRTSAAGASADIPMPQDLDASHQEAEEEAELGMPRAAPARSQLPDTNPVAKSYLCTGFDCYVVQEPCAMCAMAATHARLRRICYSVADPQCGVLGGSHKLHGQTSLNHHYQVFHLPLMHA